jgi:hypothetical protein
VNLKLDLEKAGSFILREMRSAESFFLSGTGPQKLETVAGVVAIALKAAGVPAALVDAGDAEFKAVVADIVAWDKKLNGALIGGAPAAAAPGSAKAAA